MSAADPMPRASTGPLTRSGELAVTILGLGGVVLFALFLWALTAYGKTLPLRLVGIVPLFAALEICFLHLNAQSEYRRKASVRRNNLFTLREVVNEFTKDRGHPPNALADLVAAGYLRTIPIKPFTGKPDWRAIMKDEPARFEVFARDEEPPPPTMDSTATAAVVFGVLGVFCLAGARICRQLQARMATSILILGLNLVGYISLFSALLVVLVIWKGLSRS
jgi:hypothetical protein